MRSPSADHPSTRGFHLEVEGDETELLDTVAKLKVAPVTGDVRRTSTAGRTRVRFSSVDLQGESKREGWVRERGE